MLNLNFRIEDRGSVWVLVTQQSDGAEIVRPATIAEVELWNAIAKRFSTPARETYIRVSEQDLVTALMERDHLRRQVSDLQKKNAELAEENGRLKERMADGPRSAEVEPR